jgi:hypothetical protein
MIIKIKGYKFFDADGKSVELIDLVKSEPEWAVAKINQLLQQNDWLIEKLKAASVLSQEITRKLKEKPHE